MAVSDVPEGQRLGALVLRTHQKCASDPQDNDCGACAQVPDRTVAARAGGRDPGAPDRPPWLSCRGKEWVRRLGASPPMRMSASWFGSSWTHRIQGRGAIDPRPESGLPSDRHPDRTKRAVVLEAVKVWPARPEYAARWARRPTLTPPARAGFAILRVGAKKPAPGRTKKDAPL